ncbi:hypothetical protein [Baaleninema sp.]|uniref:hypothetical protein n=1 Tax=Baaleninema sp. TaxID=3101197 RepID=UPI003CFE4428
METKELKVLLKILGHKGYQAKISEIKPTSKATVKETISLCKKLGDRELLELQSEITRFKIEAAGKTLLESDIENLPLSQDSVKALKACAEKTAKPGDIRIAAAKRQAVLHDLVDRGFVKAVETKIIGARLSERGKVFLRDEYADTSTRRNLQLMASQLTNYIQFMRSCLTESTPVVYATGEKMAEAKPAARLTEKPSDEEILAWIRKLDRELNTDNYLPIYHLREKLEPPLTRDEFENALYRLERHDKIQLSSLQESRNYTPEQVAAGIHQPVGGILFFIVLN